MSLGLETHQKPHFPTVLGLWIDYCACMPILMLFLFIFFNYWCYTIGGMIRIVYTSFNNSWTSWNACLKWKRGKKKKSWQHDRIWFCPGCSCMFLICFNCVFSLVVYKNLLFLMLMMCSFGDDVLLGLRVYLNALDEGHNTSIFVCLNCVLFWEFYYD